MKEKIILALVVEHSHNSWSPEDEAVEMSQLITTCGGEIVHTVFCKTNRYSLAYADQRQGRGDHSLVPGRRHQCSRCQL